MTYLEWFKRQYTQTWKVIEQESPAGKGFISLGNSGMSGGDDALAMYSSYARLDAAAGTGWRADVEINWGHSILRERIAERYGAGSLENVMPVAGASQAIFLAIMAFSRGWGGAGGRVARVESPGYGPMFEISRRLGFEMEMLHRRLEEDYRLPEISAGNRKADVILLTNPHNPSGALATKEEIGKLVSGLSPDGVIIVDETFLSPVDANQYSVAAMGDERIVALGGLTKTMGLGTLRCGWIIAQGKTVERLREVWVQGFNIGSRITEGIASEAIAAAEVHEERARKLFATNLPIVAEVFDELEGKGLIAWRRPVSSFIAFPRLSKAAMSREPREVMERFYSMMLNEERVGIVPGKWFDPEGTGPAAGHFRIGFSGGTEQVREGMERVRRAVERFSWG